MNSSKSWQWMCVILLVGHTAFLPGCTMRFSDDTSAPTVLTPEDLTWQDLSSGVRAAVLYGDPDRPGPFVLRLQYPPGFRKAPHHHPKDAYITVLSGSYYRGYGDSFDEKAAIKLIPGTFSVNPAGISHFEWTTEPAMLQVHAEGPWKTVYVDMEGGAH
jgi:hypothetical protein